MFRTFLVLVMAACLSSACCMACRPTPKPGPADLTNLLIDPDHYLGVRVSVRVRIDAYDPKTRTATRTIITGKSPLYRIQVSPGEDEPTPGVFELNGVVEGYERVDTGLGDRPFCLRFKDCRLVRVGE